MGKKQSWVGEYFPLFFVCIIIAPLLICGCSDRYQARSSFKEANDFFNQGSYKASLKKYKQIIEKYPKQGDRVLFEVGIIYAHPGNEEKDYKKSQEYFQKLIKDYPESEYRQDSEMMVFYINNIIMKDKTITAQLTQIDALEQQVKSKDNEITAQQTQIDALEQQVKSKETEIITLQEKIEALNQEVKSREALLLQQGPADKILIEKKARRMTLFSKGNVLNTYKIALGGEPNGPKERQGDNKTPEGTYIIDSRNEDSHYHISLHISYPNEKDIKRAKKLGVSPGGNIMIHGIKNGYSSIGDSHTAFDWTKGCIAVTDEEIEEIDKLVPDGTTVEIRP